MIELNSVPLISTHLTQVDSFIYHCFRTPQSEAEFSGTAVLYIALQSILLTICLQQTQNGHQVEANVTCCMLSSIDYCIVQIKQRHP